MTLSDLWPGLQGHDIFEIEYRKKTARLKDKVTIAQAETIPNILNGTMFRDVDWPLNASYGFVSISWASCDFGGDPAQVALGLGLGQNCG